MSLIHKDEGPPLFRDDLVYPNDGVGCYVELEGQVVSVDLDIGAVVVRVDEHGELTGYSTYIRNQPNTAPSAGDTATIRVYDSGGGFYPDNHITGWTCTVLTRALRQQEG